MKNDVAENAAVSIIIIIKIPSFMTRSFKILPGITCASNYIWRNEALATATLTFPQQPEKIYELGTKIRRFTYRYSAEKMYVIEPHGLITLTWSKIGTYSILQSITSNWIRYHGEKIAKWTLTFHKSGLTVRRFYLSKETCSEDSKPLQNSIKI